MVRKPNQRNTKTEILDAFNELLQENKTLKTQLTETKKSKRPESNGSSDPLPEPKVIVNPAQLEPQQIESILASLSRLQFNFGGAVSHLSEQLTQEAIQLQTIRQSVTEEMQQLETLHDLQADEDSLDQLIQQYEDDAKAFKAEFSQQQETVEQARNQAQKAWNQEQEENRRTIKERNETLSKTTQREAKVYAYDLRG
ncbi:MAG: DUF4337 domain-containing protein [Cyanothece sp. SIO1E1]|nr:DUF4337 domain-containing protein [Cyanothece sp. SIO1E1]